MMIKNAKVLKFVILGDGGVGKTTLAKVFCDNAYIESIMTIGIDLHAKDVIVNGKRTVLQIWDLSGQDQFKFMVPTFVGGASAAILAFDRTRPSSFLNLDSWLNELRTIEPNVPIFLISTKGDQEYHLELKPQLAREYVQKNNLIGFEDTSAKISLNVNTSFKRLLEHIFGFEADQFPIIFLGPGEEFKESIIEEPAIYSPDEPTIPSGALQVGPTPIEVAVPSRVPQINPNPVGTVIPSSSIHIGPTSIESTIPLNTPQITPSLQNSTPIKENSRLIDSLELCSFCKSHLRQSQIVLKRFGEKVLCHHCFNQT